MRTSGRYESTSRSPYRDPSAEEYVAVTPAPARATSSDRSVPSGKPGSEGTTTSATPIARSDPSLTRTRAVDPSPNQPSAGLSSVYQVSAESPSTAPNVRPTARPSPAVAVW